MKTEFYILNDHDRPSAEMIVYKKRNGRYRYAHPKLRNIKDYANMTATNPTPVSYFGICIEIQGDTVTGMLTGGSIATYRDGRPRRWQGYGSFSFKFSKK